MNKKRVWFWIQIHRKNTLVARMARLCKNVHRAYEHSTYVVELNGEMGVLSACSLVSNPVLFDVGSNVGELTKMALTVVPKARIEVFDLNPDLMPILQDEFNSNPMVSVHNIGLGDTNEEMTFFPYSGDNSVMSSLVATANPYCPH